MKAALSADIRSATPCFPNAPDGGSGALFCQVIQITFNSTAINFYSYGIVD